jgi:hypothetical protein
MEKPEEHRNKWALGLATTLTLIIFVSFAFYRGYLSFGNSGTIAEVKSQNQTAAAVLSVKSVPSPIENTKETFKSAFDEIGKQYGEFTDSMSNVLVPFFTGIEVYQRK